MARDFPVRLFFEPFHVVSICGFGTREWLAFNDVSIPGLRVGGLDADSDQTIVSGGELSGSLERAAESGHVRYPVICR